MKRHIGFVLFDGITTMDLTGPLEAFQVANEQADCGYQFHYLGIESGPVVAESGLKLFADMSLRQGPQLDTVFLPGGEGARNERIQREICPWLQDIKGDTRRIVSVCTGAFLLGQAGLLKGRKVATHWAFTGALQQLLPECRVDPDAIYCDEGDIATSAGISSGIDLSLKLIEKDFGATIAADVARYLVVHYRRSGNQAQFSTPLQHQAMGNPRFASLIGWMMNNLSRELSVSQLAEHCAMSERNFCRHFVQSMGLPPGKFVEQLRLDYVRQMLTDSKMPLSLIANAAGYKSVDVMRRAFERVYGVSPVSYRHNFTL